jgi:hypothetical protein
MEMCKGGETFILKNGRVNRKRCWPCGQVSGSGQLSPRRLFLALPAWTARRAEAGQKHLAKLPYGIICMVNEVVYKYLSVLKKATAPLPDSGCLQTFRAIFLAVFRPTC